MNPEASFDALAIVDKLDPVLGGVHQAEVHLFSYLACLLSLYRGKPVAEWGYSFVTTPDGAPFSTAIADAIDGLRRVGDLDEDGNTLRAGPSGREELVFLRSLSLNTARDVYIDGACASALALPVGVVRAGVANEPALRRMTSLQATRALLEPADTVILYEQFSALSSVLGANVQQLMVPAVAWLTYLIQTAPSAASP